MFTQRRVSSSAMLDGWLEKLRRCEHLLESELKQLCDMVKAIMVEEANVQSVSGPVTVCGDIHGQFFDLLELFNIGGQVPDTKYVFMGDYVDRGHHSVETLQLLLCLKARYPDSITLLRGNHESREITRAYGFHDECLRKYGSVNAWQYCCSVFDYFNVACLIDGRILCLHGGLSPDIGTINQISVLDRKGEVPPQGPLADLMWSDPDDIPDFKVNPRGAGWLFGHSVTREFNHTNRVELICRAHQLVNTGYQYWFARKDCITVWSAPNYCYRCGNAAAVLSFDEYLDRDVKTFKASPENPDMLKPGVQYFF